MIAYINIGESAVIRWLTAGESHGPALSAILEGMPAQISITKEMIDKDLQRRRLGFGRGARQTFEADVVSILGGVRHGQSQGGPIALQIANSEWPKWAKVMAEEHGFREVGHTAEIFGLCAKC